MIKLDLKNYLNLIKLPIGMHVPKKNENHIVFIMSAYLLAER